MTAAGTRPRAGAALVAAAVACLLAGCSSSRFAGSGTDQPPLAAAPTARPGQTPAASQAAPPADMAGRWLLASPGSGMCGMTFGAAPGGAEGTIAPEGGCPGNFFTSRRWLFERGALVIRNHVGEPLATLALAAPGRFEGQAASGETISLVR